ncbi:MAG: (deoxy)nucleoside triphosphate pyrophosphohydrolase [Solobacterium sp.]|nr:(deoxy)nucleoside triphosphate pyrophosphohydrolase [Solobacterium sp.]
MKTLKVAAAVIIHDGKIYAAERGYGSHMGWEFPGGKIKEGETSREALIREIREELSAEIDPYELLMRLEHDYDDFHLSMDVFLCHSLQGSYILHEHRQARWLREEELDDVAWLAADRKIIPVLKQRLSATENKCERRSDL